MFSLIRSQKFLRGNLTNPIRFNSSGFSLQSQRSFNLERIAYFFKWDSNYDFLIPKSKIFSSFFFKKLIYSDLKPEYFIGHFSVVKVKEELNSIVKACKLDELEQFLKTNHCPIPFHEIQLDEKSSEIILDHFVETKQLSQVSKVVEQMKRSFESESKAFNVALSILKKHNLREEINDLIDEMKLKNLLPQISDHQILQNYMSTIHSLKQQEMRSTEKYTEHMKLSYSSIIQGLAKQGRFDELKQYIQIMKSNKVPFDILIYNTFLDAYGKNGKIEELKETITQMQSQNITFNETSYYIVIESFAKAGKFEEMEKYIEEMKGLNLKINLLTYNSIIDSLSKYGNFNKMSHYIEEMKVKKFPFLISTYNSILSALIKQDRVEEFYRYVDEIKSKKLAFDLSTFNILIQMQAKQNKWKDVFTTIQICVKERKAFVLDSNTYNGIFQSINQSQNLDEIKKCFEATKIENSQPTINYNILFYLLSKQDRLREILHYIQEMKNNSISFNTNTCNILIQFFSRIKAIDRMNSLIEEMKSKSIRFDVVTYSSIIGGYISAKDSANFIKYWTEAKEFNLIHLATFNNVIQGYGTFHRADLLDRVLKEMKDYEITPNLQTYNALILSYLQCKEIDKAIQIFQHLSLKNIPWTVKMATTFLSAFENQSPQYLALPLAEKSVSLWKNTKDLFHNKKNPNEELNNEEKEKFQSFLESFSPK